MSAIRSKLGIVGLCLILNLSTPVLAYSKVDYSKLANAIRKAEGVHSKHPYGILKKFRHTSPRQACINSCKRRFKAWKKSQSHLDYISYLGSFYSPTDPISDPSGCNRNWIPNIRSLYHE